MIRKILPALFIGSLLTACAPMHVKPLYQTEAQKVKTVDVVLISKNTPVFVEQIVQRTQTNGGLIVALVVAGIDASVNSGHEKVADQARIDLAPLTNHLKDFELLKEKEKVFTSNTIKNTSPFTITSIKTVSEELQINTALPNYKTLEEIKKNSKADSILFIKTYQRFIGSEALPYLYGIRYLLMDKQGKELAKDYIEIIAPKIEGKTASEKANDLIKNDKFKNFLLHAVNLTTYALNDALLNKTNFTSEEKYNAEKNKEDNYLQSQSGKNELLNKQKIIMQQRNCSNIPSYNGYDPKLYNSLRLRMEDILVLYINCQQ